VRGHYLNAYGARPVMTPGSDASFIGRVERLLGSAINQTMAVLRRGSFEVQPINGTALSPNETSIALHGPPRSAAWRHERDITSQQSTAMQAYRHRFRVRQAAPAT
jgi:hypothetical protein